MTKSKEIEIGSVKQFLELYDELSKSYPTGFINNPTSTKFVFRGVCNDSYNLLPNVFRKIESKSNTSGSFTKYAWGNEKQILLDFIAEASTIVKDIPPNDLHRWAEYAQHFGVPTRYLDWTANPLTAIYFACSNSYENDSALWVLNTFNYDRFASSKLLEMDGAAELKDKTKNELINLILSGQPAFDYPILYQPYYVDQRMSAQSSFFMVWGNKNEPLEELIPPNNNMILSNLNSNGTRFFGSRQTEGILLKLVIKNRNKVSILRQLYMMGINEKALFPGLDGIGKYIETKYCFNYDEAIDMF